MSRKITSLISSKIEIKFEEWVNIFDNKEVDLRLSGFIIKPLFRKSSKDVPKKFICL